MEQNCKIGRTFNENGRQLTNSEILDIVSIVVDEVLTEKQRNEFVKETLKTLSKLSKKEQTWNRVYNKTFVKIKENVKQIEVSHKQKNQFAISFEIKGKNLQVDNIERILYEKFLKRN